MSESTRPPNKATRPDETPATRTAQASRATPAIPPLPAGHLAFLALAGAALLAGLDASLVRLGALAPVPSTSLGSIHGLLMIYGFLGTAICLERAVALQSDGRRIWAYAAPLLTGAGGVSAIVIALNPAVRNAPVSYTHLTLPTIYSV